MHLSKLKLFNKVRTAMIKGSDLKFVVWTDFKFVVCLLRRYVCHSEYNVFSKESLLPLFCYFLAKGNKYESISRQSTEFEIR